MTLGIAWRSCSHLTLPTRMQCQPQEVGLTGLATRSLGQNSVNAHQIDRYGGQDMLHMGFLQAIIARASYPHPSYRLGKRPLDSCSFLIPPPKLWGCLLFSPCLQGFI